MTHVLMTCEDHRDLRWSCKLIAVNKNGRYNGSRNIFYLGKLWPHGRISELSPDYGEYIRECSCSSSKLIAVNLDDCQERPEGF